MAPKTLTNEHIEELRKNGILSSTKPIEELVGALKCDLQKNYFYYQPHEKQLIFHNSSNEAKERLFLAGNRTGKTYAGCMEVVMHLTGNYPEWWQGHRYTHPIDAWAASNTAQTTRDILQKQYYLGAINKTGLIGDDVIIRKTMMSGVPEAVDTVYIKHITGGVSTLGFKAYDQGRAKFQGTRKHLIHFDEEPPLNVYTEALIRTMSTAEEDQHGMIILTLTPLSGWTDILNNFCKDTQGERTSGRVYDDKRFFIYADWQDNPALSENEIQSLRQSIPEHEREAREKGIPSLGSGKVYPIAESRITCDPFPIPSYWPKMYAIDFGWKPSPTAILFGAYDRDNDILYIRGEYTALEKTPQQIIGEISNIPHFDYNMVGVCDPAGGQSSLKDGTNIYDLYKQTLPLLIKANNKKEGKDGEGGVLDVLQRMQNGQLKIFNSCKQTLGELRTYARDDLGRIKKGNDHLMDAMRYMVRSGIKATANRDLYTHDNSYEQPINAWAM